MDDFDKALKKYSIRSPTRKSNRIQSKGTRINLETLQDDESGYRFDSKLEATVYRFLRQVWSQDEIIMQPLLTFHSDPITGLALTWKPDFYIPSTNRYLEVKGQWINEPQNKAEKSLFIWKYVTALSYGHKVIICSDKAYEISKLQIVDYVTAIKELKHNG